MEKLSKRRFSAKKDYNIFVTYLAIILMFVFQIILGKMIGDKGLAYFGVAGELWLVFSGMIAYGLTEAVASLVRYRIKREQYKSAQKVLSGAITTGIILGLIISVLMSIFAFSIADKLIRVPLAGMAIRLMAPAIFFTILTGVLRGYFYGSGTKIPVMHSKLLQPLFLFGGGLIGASLLGRYGEKVSALLQNEDYSYSYGATGACIGILTASILCFLHMFVIYMLFKNRLKSQASRELQKNQDSKIYVIYMLFNAGVLYTLYFMFLHGQTLLDGIVLFRIAGGANEIISQWGTYYGRVLPFIGIIIGLICMFCLPIVRKVMVLREREEHRMAREKVGILIHQCAAITIPAAIFLAVLSENLLDVIFGGNNKQASLWMQAASIIIVFCCFTLVFMEVLQKNKRMSYVVGISASGFLLHIGALLVLVKPSNISITSVIVANILFYAATMVGSFLIVARMMQYRQEWIRTFALTIIASAISGVIAMLLNKAFEPLLGDFIALLICLVVGILCYLILLVVTRAFRQEELENIPLGFLIIKLSELLHFI